MIEVDTKLVNELMLDIYEAMCAHGEGGIVSYAVRDETRRLAVGIAKFTPPQNLGVGQNAVKRELSSLFSEATNDLIGEVGSVHGLTNIDTYVTQKDGSKLRLKWDRIDPSGKRMREFHMAAINDRGKIPKSGKQVMGTWRARVIVPPGELSLYKKKIITHVGRWKASWAMVCMNLGATTIAGWIKRHLDNRTAPGISDTTGLMNGEFPTVTFGSRAPAVTRQLESIRDAVRARTEAMKKRFELIISDFDKGRVRGMRLNTQAARERAKRAGNYNGGHYSID